MIRRLLSNKRLLIDRTFWNGKVVKVGWYDKIQILDFGLTHKTGGANHKINDFCFLKFFISIKFDPHQAQKTIFTDLSNVVSV